MTEKKQCAGRVWSPGAWRSSPCSNTAKHHEDGKDWCGIHLPSRKKEKEERRHAERSAEWKAREARRAHETALAKAREAVVEAAKVWRNHEVESSDYVSAFVALESAVDALNDLEAKGPANG